MSGHNVEIFRETFVINFKISKNIILCSLSGHVFPKVKLGKLILSR